MQSKNSPPEQIKIYPLSWYCPKNSATVLTQPSPTVLVNFDSGSVAMPWALVSIVDFLDFAELLRQDLAAYH